MVAKWSPRPGQWVMFRAKLAPAVLMRHESNLPAVHRATDKGGEWLVGIFDGGGKPYTLVGGLEQPAKPARIMLCDVLGNNVESFRMDSKIGPAMVNVGFGLDEVDAIKPLLDKAHIPPGRVTAAAWVPLP